MGNRCCGEQEALPILHVASLHNRIANQFEYKVINCDSIRFEQINAYKTEKFQYLFTMGMKNEIEIKQSIPVLNELVHCYSYPNYNVTLIPRMLVDIFDIELSSTLIEAKHPKTLKEFSIKVVPYTSYNQIQFKKALYELYLNKQVGYLQASTHKLIDYYIYGLNQGEQSLVMLFERATTSLANIAEYRISSNLFWSEQEKIKIIYDIFSSYQALHNKNIVHRDLRPSNVYYVPEARKFVIGNLSRARIMRRDSDTDLMSVCGVPMYSTQERRSLMESKQQIGVYMGIRQDYMGLISIIDILETCKIFDHKNMQFKTKEIKGIVQMLRKDVDFKLIMPEVEKLMTLYKVDKDLQTPDNQIATTCSNLLASTHHDTMEQFLFEVYWHMGLHKEYSEKAHKILEKNNLEGKQYLNAPILAGLGDYYTTKGTNGSEYYYNAFVLYIKRAEDQLKYGRPEQAQNQRLRAQDLYFKFNEKIESDLSWIEIKRISALVQLAYDRPGEAEKIIQEVLLKASKSNIPVERQCRVLLAIGTIYRANKNNVKQAQKKLKVGLTICQNPSQFDSIISCSSHRSKFQRQYAMLKMRELKEKIDPLVPYNTEKWPQLKAEIEANLRTALQRQERIGEDDIEVAATLEQLADFYYTQHNFYNAEIYCSKTLLRLNGMKKLIDMRKYVLVSYMKGTSLFYLKQYARAKEEYMGCLEILDKSLPKNNQNLILRYNIEGNIGLVLHHMGSSEGKPKMQSALQRIKQVKGAQSYDYAALAKNYEAIKNK